VLSTPPLSLSATWRVSPVRRGKHDLAGVVLVIGIYAVWLIVFWQYLIRFRLPF